MKTLHRNGLLLAISVALGAASVCPPNVAGVTIQFQRITSNSAQNVAGQLLVDLTDLGSGNVEFTVRNTGPIASSIGRVYFQDGPLLGPATITDGSGVSFEDGGTPNNLPGGSGITPPFVATRAFTATALPPVAPDGVDPGQWLKLDFQLVSGKTFNDLVNALEFPDSTGNMRIGLHVLAIGTGGQSDAFVNVPPVMVPDHGNTVLLLAVSILGLAALTRNFSKIRI